MIRLSSFNDLNGIIAVWNEAFGDPEKDIKFFLDKYFNPENTVVCEMNGDIASVLFLIDGDMHIDGEDYSSYYLYAACTLKKYRGRGIMSEMLDFVKHTASSRKKSFIALKPAESSLFDYYSKFGYKSVFSKKIITFDKTDYSEDSCLTFNRNMYSYSGLRDGAYRNLNYFKWNNDSIEFAIEHHVYYGGEIIRNCNGYMLYNMNNNNLYVKETTFSTENLSKIISDTVRNCFINKIIVELPVDYDLNSEKSEIIKSGMILPLSEIADKNTEKICNAYLALTLD